MSEIMDEFKVFSSGHLYGVGLIVVVTTVTEKLGCYYIETFAFSLYDENIFKGKTVTYEFDAPKIIEIEDEIKLCSTLIIYEILSELYGKKKDSDLKNQHPELVEINRSILLNMKSRQLHLDKLEWISKNSRSESLKEYLGTILSLSIIIKDYEIA